MKALVAETSSSSAGMYCPSSCLPSCRPGPCVTEGLGKRGEGSSEVPLSPGKAGQSLCCTKGVGGEVCRARPCAASGAPLQRIVCLLLGRLSPA